MEGDASRVDPTIQKPRKIDFKNKIIECFSSKDQEKAKSDVKKLSSDYPFRFKSLNEEEQGDDAND